MSDITELFERDPLHYSDQDIAAIVARMRDQNTQFELGAKPPPKPKEKSPKTVDLLKDLGLG